MSPDPAGPARDDRAAPAIARSFPTYGPRFSGGYQFPRSSSAVLSRGDPLRVEILGTGASASIVPLTGGRRRAWDVCGTWITRGVDGGLVTVQSTTICHDELEAVAEFQRLIRQITRERSAPCPSLPPATV